VPPLPALAISVLIDGDVGSLWSAVQNAPWLGLLAPLYLGVLASVVAYAIWGNLLQRYPTGAVAPFALLAPAVGAIASALVTGESFGPVRLSGMACMLVGLAIVVLPAYVLKSSAAYLGGGANKFVSGKAGHALLPELGPRSGIFAKLYYWIYGGYRSYKERRRAEACCKS
jgi:hypothetical protein